MRGPRDCFSSKRTTASRDSELSCDVLLCAAGGPSARTQALTPLCALSSFRFSTPDSESAQTNTLTHMQLQSMATLLGGRLQHVHAYQSKNVRRRRKGGMHWEANGHASWGERIAAVVLFPSLSAVSCAR